MIVLPQSCSCRNSLFLFSLFLQARLTRWAWSPTLRWTTKETSASSRGGFPISLSSYRRAIVADLRGRQYRDDTSGKGRSTSGRHPGGAKQCEVSCVTLALGFVADYLIYSPSQDTFKVGYSSSGCILCTHSIFHSTTGPRHHQEGRTPLAPPPTSAVAMLRPRRTLVSGS